MSLTNRVRVSDIKPKHLGQQKQAGRINLSRVVKHRNIKGGLIETLTHGLDTNLQEAGKFTRPDHGVTSLGIAITNEAVSTLVTSSRHSNNKRGLIETLTHGLDTNL